MFDPDKWQEIFETVRQNKLRTVLTGLSVGWGIFMLILLLGAGKGLENGIERQIKGDAINSIWIRGGRTTEPYQGLKPGRRIELTNEDYEALEQEIPEIEHMTARFYIPGRVLVTRDGEYGNFNVRCVHPGHKFTENTQVPEGRYINDLDIEEYRKVTVIGRRVEKALFPKGSAIGKYLQVNDISFKVVGIFEENIGDQEEEELIYLPVSTAQRTFNGSNKLNRILLTVGDATLEESKDIAQRIHRLIAERHRFSMKDRRAAWVDNNLEDFEEFKGVMRGIRIFIWCIAIGTLLAGIIGVSNIMIIVVKERTKEIGIRKALGATPRSIVSLILQEAVFITALSGYLGILVGILALEFYNSGLWLDFFQGLGMMQEVELDKLEIFYNPSVDLRVAFQAMVLLVIAGGFAGWLPARKAAEIRPVEALRAE
jgi:putative ABC transport system permease protein